MKYNKSQLISLFLLYIIFLSKNTKAHTLDKIIAIVNEDVILESDIKKTQIFNTKYNQNHFHKKNHKFFSNKEILNQLITDTLILQLAQQAKIHLHDDQIKNIINYIAEENNITTEELKIHLLNNNINYDFYADYIRNNTIINTMSNYQMKQRIKISPYELNTLTKKLMLKNNNIAFQLDHVLIPLQENATNKQIQKAKLLGDFLTKEMKHGIDIKKLITIYSLNDKNIQIIQINKIHWSTTQELPTLFVEHLNKEKIYINNVIGPIHSNVGFHILKINDIDHLTEKNITMKIHARHIFIKTSNINNDQKIHKKLLKTKRYIENGYTTFSIEAQQISEDLNSSYKGGDLGWKYIEDFDKTLQAPIKSLKNGGISEPIKTEHGWYLIQLINKEQVDKNEIFYQQYAYQKIFNKKVHETMSNWVQELKTLTYIKIFTK